MLETGWAALFIIYPSLPKLRDFQLAVDAAKNAYTNKYGQWANGYDFLLGYEYRMCIKLGTQLVTAKKGSKRKRFYTTDEFEAKRNELTADGWTFSMNAEQSPAEFVKKAFQRHCVDIETKKLVGRFRFDLVPPWKRMWIWDSDKTPELLGQLGIEQSHD